LKSESHVLELDRWPKQISDEVVIPPTFVVRFENEQLDEAVRLISINVL
jgi:hypothetical protein